MQATQKALASWLSHCCSGCYRGSLTLREEVPHGRLFSRRLSFMAASAAAVWPCSSFSRRLALFTLHTQAWAYK